MGVELDFRESALGLGPLNLVKDAAKAVSPCGMDHSHEFNFAFEMQTEVRMPVSVLAFAAAAHTVGECCLKAVEVCAGNV